MCKKTNQQTLPLGIIYPIETGKGKCAHSIRTQKIKEPDFPYQDRKISCTTELVDFARSLQLADNEIFLTIYLDAQNSIIMIKHIEGTVNQAIVYPREVIRHALLINATAMILLHNHPSGHLQPSSQDIRLTDLIRDAGKLFDILIHDHIIIGGDRFYSFREEGCLS